MGLNVALIIVIIAVAIALVVGFLVLGIPIGGGKMRQRAKVSNSLRSLVEAQRIQKDGSSRSRESKHSLALAAAAQAEIDSSKKTRTSKINVEKKLRYAKWPITPVIFRAIQGVVATIMLITLITLKTHLFLTFISAAVSWLMVGAVLDYAVDRRFKAFDKDYPVLLLSYVSLLRTGMNTMTGLEAAAKGLPESSLVRAEIELLLERLRLGLTEEQAIGAFGEDIPHPELELFVQSLILSRRVGGTLSSTLERLAKQVRKRQQFREQAIGAVGMERKSLQMIALIMTSLYFYIMYKSPELVLPAFKHPTGSAVIQFALGLIIFGFYWSRQVTKIKI